MTRPTLLVGDVWDDALANAAGFPKLDGADAYGSGPKVVDGWLDDGANQIKARFYSFFDRIQIVAPVSGRTISFATYKVLRVNGTLSTYAAGTLVLPDDTTGFIYLTSTGVMGAGTALPEVGVHIANFVTNGGAIASLVDVRYQVNEVVKPLFIPDQNGFQIGDLKTSARTSGGVGWIPCNGASFANATYPLLATAIGTVYNVPGDPIGTFRVPNTTDRTVGQSSPQNTLGSLKGAFQVTMNSNQLPRHGHLVTENAHTHIALNAPHSHVVTDSGHNHNVNQSPHAHPVNDPGHFHPLRNKRGANIAGLLTVSGAELSDEGPGNIQNTSTVDSNISIGGANANINISGATSNVSVAASSITVVNAASKTFVAVAEAGNGHPFNVLNPTVYLNYFIRAF